MQWSTTRIEYYVQRPLGDDKLILLTRRDLSHISTGFVGTAAPVEIKLPRAKSVHDFNRNHFEWTANERKNVDETRILQVFFAYFRVDKH